MFDCSAVLSSFAVARVVIRPLVCRLELASEDLDAGRSASNDDDGYPLGFNVWT